MEGPAGPCGRKEGQGHCPAFLSHYENSWRGHGRSCPAMGRIEDPGGHAIRHSGVEEEPLLEAPTTDWLDNRHSPKPDPATEVRHSSKSDGTETQDGSPGSAEVETGRVCAQPPEERQDQGNLGRESQLDHLPTRRI